MAAYAQRKLLKQRGAAVGSSTDRNRRTFNSTDAPDTEQCIQGATRRTEAVLKEKGVQIQHSTNSVSLVYNIKHGVISLLLCSLLKHNHDPSIPLNIVLLLPKSFSASISTGKFH